MSGLGWNTVFWLLGLFVLMAMTALIGVYAERKVIGHFQARLGPMHHGWHGLLQLPADMVKMISKEDVVPYAADKILFQVAPMFVAVPAFVSLSAMTFMPGTAFVDMRHGLFFVFAMQTIMPVGFALIGWSCDNKYTLLGGLRAAAQLISYEIPMLLAAMGVVMSVGSMRLTDIAAAQATGPWFIVRQPIGFVIFSIAVLAEINRTPFDMSEADSELVAGYHTEYSGMKFGLVQLAEYTALLMGSYLIATLFLGGWNMPFLPASPVWLFLKTVLLMGSTMWFRSTFPRMKVDALMEMSWKVLIPVALANIMLIASLMLVLPKRWF